VIGVVYAAETGISPAISTTAMSLGGFLIPLLTAYVCGRMGDERFLAYAFYPLIGYMMPVVFGMTSAGVFGFLMVVFGLLGAFNGANMAARRANRRRHSISRDE
jgi:ABC-type antimicrobial peptide transport system permease subunit